MTVATAASVTRFRRSRPCPICGGGDDMPRGHGKRCSGYLSSDERFAYCTREEHAGVAPLEQTDPPSYRHILEGECRCGVTHSPARQRELVATYDYLDENRTLLFQVVRLAGKQFRQRRPDGSGGWIWNLNQTRRVLYRLPDVLAAAAVGETVYVVEGEKDVHAIEAAGGVATCNPGGAEKWKPEYAEALAGARVVVVADRDDKGVAHARQVAASLPAARVELVQAAEGKDAHDHLAAGHGLLDFAPLTLADHDQQVEDLPPIIIEPLRAFLKRDLPKSEALVGTTRDGTNLLPRYGWVMPWGKEGCGKTSILVDLLFHAASGIKWLHYPIARQIRVVAIINEGVPGGLQDKLAEKAKRWEGDLDQVLDNIAIYASPWGEFTFRNERAARHARDYAVDFQADYVALDPLHTLGTTGAGTPQETEEFKHVLRGFGMWQDLGVITAHHSNKTGMVSGDWARHPDTVIRLEKDPKRPATKLTLEKARPADPHELGVPQLLEWQTDTLGYHFVPLDTREIVTDEELLGRINDTLRDAPEPLTMTALQEAVTGDSKRISDLVKSEIEAGRIANRSARKGRYLLDTGAAATTRDTDNTDNATADAQTSMDTEIHVGEQPTPTTTDTAAPPDGGAVVGGAPSPLKGAPTPTTDHGPSTNGDHPGYDPDEPGPSQDDIDRWAALADTDEPGPA